MVRAAEQAAAAAAGTSQRRSRNLERNRVAASKCRRRKAKWQIGLEDKKNELESRYKALRSETEELADEVAQLKHMVMAHAFCNDANIDAWLRNQANNLTWSVGSSATPPGQASQASSSQASSSQASSSQASSSQASSSPDATSTEEHMLNFDADLGLFDADFESLIDATMMGSQLQMADHVDPSLLNKFDPFSSTTTALVGTAYA